MKILPHDIALKKVFRRAVLSTNPEMEHIDWLNVVFKINPSERDDVTVLSIRPKDRTKYSKGTYFMFRKLNLEKKLPTEVQVVSLFAANYLDKKKLSVIMSRILAEVNGKHFKGNNLILDVEGVQLDKNTDTEVNCHLLRKTSEGQLVEVDYDVTINRGNDFLGGKFYLQLYAGSHHPLFYGEQTIKLI